MRVTLRSARRLTTTAVAVLLFVSIAPANSQEVSSLQEALEIAIAYAVPIPDAEQPAAESVLEGGGGREPIRVVAHGSFVFDERVDPLGPAFTDVGPGGVEVVADFVPDTSAFYDISLRRVVHAFKLDRALDGCVGFEEFALFYAQAGSPTFPAREGLNSPDLGMSHASAIACVDAGLRALHVQAAQLGVEFGPAHRAMVVTAPDLDDPTKRCTWVLIVTENPDVEVRPVLTTADTFGDPQLLSFRRYSPAAPEPMDLGGESEALGSVQSLLRGTGVVPVDTPDESNVSQDPPVVEPEPEAPALGEPTGDPDDDSGGSSTLWIVGGVLIVGVIVVAGVRILLRDTSPDSDDPTTWERAGGAGGKDGYRDVLEAAAAAARARGATVVGGRYVAITFEDLRSEAVQALATSGRGARYVSTDADDAIHHLSMLFLVPDSTRTVYIDTQSDDRTVLLRPVQPIGMAENVVIS